MKKIIGLCVFFLFICLLASAQIKGTYAIKNVQTGMLLRIKDANPKNGTPIVSYSPEDWKCMTWDFKNVEGNTYRLQNLFSNKSLQPQGTVIAGVTLEEQPFSRDADIQLYDFEPAGDNTYLIKLKGTDLYITPTKNGEVNSQIVLAKKTAGKSQLWTIYQQSPTM